MRTLGFVLVLIWLSGCGASKSAKPGATDVVAYEKEGNQLIAEVRTIRQEILEKFDIELGNDAGRVNVTRFNVAERSELRKQVALIYRKIHRIEQIRLVKSAVLEGRTDELSRWSESARQIALKLEAAGEPDAPRKVGRA